MEDRGRLWGKGRSVLTKLGAAVVWALDWASAIIEALEILFVLLIVGFLSYTSDSITTADLCEWVAFIGVIGALGAVAIAIAHYYGSRK